jgi:hypothetical protein
MALATMQSRDFNSMVHISDARDESNCADGEEVPAGRTLEKRPTVLTRR